MPRVQYATSVQMVETTEIAMPALSSTMTEGKISQWLKGVGDKVEAGDMVLVVESDKADMDVESYEEGYIAKILVPEGESAAVGAPVALLVENEADIAAVKAGGAAPAAACASAPTLYRFLRGIAAVVAAAPGHSAVPAPAAAAAACDACWSRGRG